MATPTKTLNDIIEAGYTYPEYVETAQQTVINSWFGDRIVCDDDKFPVYFNRVLARDYNRYTQLLRIEPGVSQFDWLVQHYTETLRQTSDTDTHNATKNTLGTLAGSDTHTTTTHDESTGNLTGTTTASGEYEDNSTGSHTDNDTFSQTRTPNLTTTDNRQIDTTGSRNVTEDGGYTDTGSTGGTHSGTSNTIAANKTANKQAPMSIQSATTGGVSGTTSGGSAKLADFDWTYASAVQQNDVDSTVTDSSQDTGTSSLQHDIDRTEDTTTSGNETHSGTVTNTGNETLASTDGKTGSTTGHAEGTNSQSVNNTQGSTTERDITSSLTDTLNHTTSGEETTTATKNATGEEKLISTGRSTAPAQILDDARIYIQSSSAWEWFSGQLEKCFLGVYEI